MTTEKQRDFAAKLYRELGEIAPELSETDALTVTEVLTPVGDSIQPTLTGEASGASASAVIDHLITALKTSKELLGVVEYRWEKVGDNWFIKGPNLEAGKTYTVTSGKGEKQVTVATVSGGFGVPERKKIEIREDVSEGIWRNDDEQLIEVALTRNGQLVGKLIDEETGKREYLGKRGLGGLTRKLTLEEAQEWGRRTGVCCSCGRELTDPDSISRGLGPICARRF